MEWLTDWFLALVAQTDHPLVLLILAGSAAIEYVFPPFPGDTITLLGAILITGYSWSFGLVLLAVMAGSMAGSMLAFGIGHWWGRKRERTRSGTEPGLLDDMVARFHRHGAVYLVLNRFAPGIRGLFFVAAGLAHMRWRAVLFYSAMSAALWNLGLIAVGSLLGANLERLESWVRRYTIAAWIVLALAGLAIGWRVWRRRARRKISD